MGDGRQLLASLRAARSADQDSVFMPLEIGRVRAVLSGLASVLELVVEITGHLEDQLASERKILDLRQAGGERDPSAKAADHASRRAGVCLRMAMAEALTAADRLRMAAQALAPPGVLIEEADLRHVHTVHVHGSGPEPRLGLFFEARRWIGEPVNREPDKCSALGWFDLDDLPREVIDYPAAGVHAYRDSIPFSVRGWTERTAPS